jgi:hypothetical protein
VYRPYVGAKISKYNYHTKKWEHVGVIDKRCDLSGDYLFEYVNLNGKRVFGNSSSLSPFYIEAPEKP